MRFLCLLSAFTVGCTINQPATVTGLQSLEVKITAPTNLGTPGAPVLVTDLTFDITARDASGEILVSDLDVDLYVSYAGNKIGMFTNCGKNEDTTPLERLHLKAGQLAAHSLHLPRAYGVTNLWLEEAQSHAVGASQAIYFANPTVADVQTPLDPNSPTATYCSTFEKKHVIIDRAAGSGKLVVTSVFNNAYVVADTGANYDPVKGTGGYNHLYVFSFGRPAPELVPGRILKMVEGNLSKFVGFTELNFPLQEASKNSPDPNLLPLTYALKPADRNQHGRLLRLDAATVSLSGTVCPINAMDSSWMKYNQFVLDLGDGVCDSRNTFAVELPGKLFSGVDWVKSVGKAFQIVGMLRNLSGQNEATKPPTLCHAEQDCLDSGLSGTSCVEGTCKKDAYNSWLVSPRTSSDITPENI